MKFLSLSMLGISRNWLRTALTIGCIAIAFLLYGLLQPVATVFTSGPQNTSENRLIVTPRHSITDMLSLRHYSRVSQLRSNDVIAHQTWFGGNFRDGAVTFPQWAVSQDHFFDVIGEADIPADQLDKFKSVRTGAILGRQLADQLDVHLGQGISLTPTIWHNRNESAWEFEVVGIYETRNQSSDARQMFFRFDYLDEHRAFGHGLISNVLLKVEDSDSLNEVAAEIDAEFANSADETLTVTEKDYLLSFMQQLGNVGLLINSLLLAVSFTILLVTMNTMSQSFRERVPELAVLKTMGFSDQTIFVLVLVEAGILFVAGASLGLLGAELLLGPFSDIAVANQMGSLAQTGESIAIAIAIALFAAFAAGAQPAFKAMTLNICDALRGTDK